VGGLGEKQRKYFSHNQNTDDTVKKGKRAMAIILLGQLLGPIIIFPIVVGGNVPKSDDSASVGVVEYYHNFTYNSSLQSQRLDFD